MKHKIYGCSSAGKLMMLIGGLVALPLLVLPFYPEDIGYATAFALPSLGSALLGMIICFFIKRDIGVGTGQHTYNSLTVLFAWIWGIFVGMLPFVIGGQLSVVQSLFESVSGWTTTGLSVMDVSTTPHIFLFFRSFMQFSGGLGFVMVMVMLVMGKQSMDLYNAEGHPDKLSPNLKRTARTIFLMYISFFAVGSLIYYIVGMNLFDAVLHTMCALSTGGFSTQLNSIGEYHSASIETVTILLMLVGTTNFATLLLLLKGKLKNIIRISEIRFMFLLLIICIPVVAVSLTSFLNLSIGEGFHQAIFNVISALSTTGYSTIDYMAWPQFAIGIIILLMLIGGGLGSTAGGIKLTRVYIMLRLIFLSIRKRISPSRKIEAPYYIRAQGKTPIDYTLAFDTMGFIACYAVLFIIGSLLMVLTAKCNLMEGMFEFASAIGTVGLSIGLTNPATGEGTLIVEILGMILGRLEIYIVFIGIYSGILDIRKNKKHRARI